MSLHKLAKEHNSLPEDATLGFSEGTVRKHTEQVYRAVGVRSRAELAALLK